MDKKKEIASLDNYPPQIQHKSFPDGAFYSDALYAYLGLDPTNYSRWCKQYLLKNPAAYGEFESISRSSCMTNDRFNPKASFTREAFSIEKTAKINKFRHICLT